MDTITVQGHVDQQHQLSASVPASFPPGPVTILIVPAPQLDEAEMTWMTGIAGEWREDLADERQDIYTPADGEPLDES